MKTYYSFDPENGFMIHENPHKAEETAMYALERYNAGFIPSSIEEIAISWGTVSGIGLPIMKAFMERCE